MVQMTYDEFAESLDTDGRSAMLSIFDEQAKDRCIVVITHDEMLADELSAVMRLKVENGAIINV